MKNENGSWDAIAAWVALSTARLEQQGHDPRVLQLAVGEVASMWHQLDVFPDAMSDHGERLQFESDVLREVQRRHGAFGHSRVWRARSDGESAAAAEEPSPRPARLLTWAVMLLAPGERENWLGELHTVRWELRGDTPARRAATWSFFRGLGVSAVASWRHGGAPSQETS